MAESKKQILVGLTDSLIKQIEDYRFEHKINSRSEAIREMLERTLKATK